MPNGFAIGLQILNAAAPGILNLILAIKHTDGSMTATMILDQADKGFQDNIDAAQAWLAAHAKASPAKT